MDNKTLFKTIDLYKFTTLEAGMQNGNPLETVTYEFFYRDEHFGLPWAVAAGMSEFPRTLKAILDHLPASINSKSLDGLVSKETRSFVKRHSYDTDVIMHTVKEGTLIPPKVPFLTITAPRWKARLIETQVLNCLNYQILIASKALQLSQAANGRMVIDFSPRRAPLSEAALYASRSAYIGGCAGTSNLAASEHYGLALKGTHDHSFVQEFDSEIEAFRAFAKTYSGKIPIYLLVDTYELMSGIDNAIKVSKEYPITGIRIDSRGFDLKSVRAKLDAAYLDLIRSSDIDYKDIIEDNLSDGFGCGTKLACGYPHGAFAGVFKMVARGGRAVHKPSIHDQSKNAHGGLKDCVRVVEDDTIRYLLVSMANEADRQLISIYQEIDIYNVDSNKFDLVAETSEAVNTVNREIKLLKGKKVTVEYV